METCQSGLMYLLAKEADFNQSREFESLRLRHCLASLGNTKEKCLLLS